MSLKPTGAYFIDHLIHDCIGLLLFTGSRLPRSLVMGVTRGGFPGKSLELSFYMV